MTPVATPTPTPPTQVIVPCDVTKDSEINFPTVAVVVQTTDKIIVIRTVEACGPDGKAVVGTATAKTVLVNSQTVTATGSGNISTTLTTTPGGSCGKPVPKQ